MFKCPLFIWARLLYPEKVTSRYEHCTTLSDQRSVTNETASNLDGSAIDSFIVSLIIQSLLTISFQTVTRPAMESKVGTHP